MRILKFSQADCKACDDLAARLEEEDIEIMEYEDETNYAVKQRGVFEVMYEDNADLFQQYGVRVTPTMVAENLWGKEKRRLSGNPKTDEELGSFLWDAEDDYLR